MQRSSKIILTVVAVALIATIVAKLISPAPVSDTDQISQQLTAAAGFASSKDVVRVMSIISDDYTDDNGDNPELLNMLLRRGFSNVQQLDVTLSTIKIDVVGNSATTTCYMTIHGDGQEIFNQMVTLKWQKEETHRYLIVPDQVWRVTHSNFNGSLPDGI